MLLNLTVFCYLIGGCYRSSTLEKSIENSFLGWQIFSFILIALSLPADTESLSITLLLLYNSLLFIDSFETLMEFFLLNVTNFLISFVEFLKSKSELGPKPTDFFAV